MPGGVDGIGTDELLTYLTSYFKLADMKKYFKDLDSWLRRRIRMVIWKQCISNCYQWQKTRGEKSQIKGTPLD
ncbi:MAG: group II intron maturase-specific domain-containing protein [Bacteroidales bacterium]|nr:group II intron maturase-specific domain-containing protein [Bacteroidales bacterium]